jgi:hypothetical protein
MTPLSNFLERLKHPLPGRWFRVRDQGRDQLASVAPALLFVPMLQTTIATLQTQAPWGVGEAQR